MGQAFFIQELQKEEREQIMVGAKLLRGRILGLSNQRREVKLRDKGQKKEAQEISRRLKKAPETAGWSYVWKLD